MAAMWILLAFVAHTCMLHTGAFTLHRALRDVQESKLEINMCYFCEKSCKDYIRSIWDMEEDDFARSLTAEVETELKTLNDNFQLNMTWVGTYPASLSMTQFIGSSVITDAEARITAANDNLWAQLFDSFAAQNCDVAFTLVEPGDDIFDGGIRGIARVNTICKDASYGTVSLFNNIPKIADLLTHELGHVLGIYHDGDGPNLASQITERYPDEMAAINADCANVGNTRHVMNPLGDLAVGHDKHFSECSKRYFALYVQLEIWSETLYSLACLRTTQKLE